MYTIYADNVCIYNDVLTLDNMKAINPKLVLEDNAAGYLSITLPQSNIGYNSIRRMVTDISVKKENKEIWAGRVLSEGKDFWNSRTLYCEGELAFLNDTSQPQKEYMNLTIRGYLETLLAVHNTNMPANRRFTIGAVTVYDANFPTHYTNHEKTIELINNLVKQYGGHIRVRKENGIRYLDYLAEYPDTCSQVIRFGQNLIEFTRQWDSADFATVVIPLGHRLKDSPVEALDAYLTVESVNGGDTYVQSNDAVATYGWIEKVVRWDDVTDPSTLLEKAKTYLTDLQFDNMRIELSAIDLHYLNVDQEAVKLLDEIQVISPPHGMNRTFPITKLEIPLDSPEKTVFTLGDTVKTSFINVNNQSNSEILQKIEELPKAHAILTEAKENATQIMNMATTGYITITKDKYGSDTLYISNVRDYTIAGKLWKWSMNGLGYSRDGGKTFGLAMTMDGAIVADFITTGTMSADRVRTGLLTDIYENVKFDLNTGTLTIKSGTIDIGDGAFKVDMDGNLTARKGTFAGKLVAATGTFGGELQAATGNFQGSLDIGDGAFKVDSDGNLTASKGIFYGVVQASDFKDIAGNSMLNSGKFKADYLSLYGLTVTNKSTGATTFQISSTGDIAINGKITMGNGSSINWASVTHSNLDSNPAYQLASTANNNANNACNRADDAYKLATSISFPIYIKSTYIDSVSIRSPVIEGGQFYGSEFNVIADNDYGSFNLYASFGGTRYHMFAINYFASDAPYIYLYSPCGGYMDIGSSNGITYFKGIVDFSNATVRGFN